MVIVPWTVNESLRLRLGMASSNLEKNVNGHLIGNIHHNTDGGYFMDHGMHIIRILGTLYSRTV